MLRNNSFIERSIMGAVSFLKESVFAEDSAIQDGFLQARDPRIKTVSFAIFLITTLFLKSISLIFCLYLGCLLLAQLSKINLIYFLKRTWIFIPIFSLFSALPALFSVFSPGETLFSFNILQIKLTITRQGLCGATLFFSRVITSVSFVILLSFTTRHTELLHVLRTFGIPQVFVMVMGMCYRYIYFFVVIAENTYLAIKSRAGTGIHYHKGQRIVALNIATLWQRSYGLSQAVYSAMLSRGYTGEPKVLYEFKTCLKDWMWLFFAGALSAGVMFINYALNI